MSRVTRTHAACLVFALTCTAVFAGESPARRPVVVLQPECAEAEGCRCSQQGCRSWYDLAADGMPRLAELAAAREKDRRATRERGLALEAETCEAGDVETCLRLARPECLVRLS